MHDVRHADLLVTNHSDFQATGQDNAALNCNPTDVYVIDDHQEVRRSLTLLLGTFDLAIRPFSSAAAFLERLPSLVPAPVLLDITMPGMSGIELLEELATRNVKWPVLIMTGLNDAPVVLRALELGAMGLLQKPFSAEALEAAVRSALAAVSKFDTISSSVPFDAAR